MSEPLPKDAESLETLRREIDAVDAEMHRLLIRRGEVIEQLITAKGRHPAGSAFRPDREADMLTRIAGRHSGRLPLATVEHIWREIIGTFTQLQAPFRVHAIRAGQPAMRDLLRFHFGFATSLVEQASPEDVIAAIGAQGSDLGVVPLGAGQDGAWWRGLTTASGGVRATALLPFLTMADGWPQSLVVGSADIGNPAADVTLWAASGDAGRGPGAVSKDLEILAVAGDELLLAMRGEAPVMEAAREAGLALRDIQQVGDYCAPPAEARASYE